MSEEKYELLTNFKKCPNCESRNIKENLFEGEYVGWLACGDCKAIFTRQVEVENPRNSMVVMFNRKTDGTYFLPLPTKKNVFRKIFITFCEHEKVEFS